MQIVRDLAGYTFGQSDNLRRAMSKKKAEVMSAERQSFVYGDPSRNIPGCVSKGISEKVANKIYDEMVDFAKYAFNKSHAACYAVVAYQTAYLKCHYPVEFMAALITSVIENTKKVAAYIHEAGQMGIKVLPPDVNLGSAEFGVENGSIHYGLSAIKGMGRNVINQIVEERKRGGSFKDIRDFCTRLSDGDVTKRTIENLIKAGAFDSLPGTRKQLLQLYTQIVDDVAREKKKNLSGQMSLFDLMDEEDTSGEGLIKYPEVGEYDKGQLLAFEKEVLGIYVSGHPLEEDMPLIEKNVTVYADSFELDDETGVAEVKQDSLEIVAGMVTEKTMKTTKRNEMMCFMTIEDVTGQIEVIVFPKVYERYRDVIREDARLFVKGRVSVEEDKPAKLICQEILSFAERPREVWIRYDSLAAAMDDNDELWKFVGENPGVTKIMLYCDKEKKIKALPAGKGVSAEETVFDALKKKYGADNVSVKDISLKKYWNINPEKR